MREAFCILCGCVAPPLEEDTGGQELKLKLMLGLYCHDSLFGKLILENPEAAVCNREECVERVKNVLQTAKQFMEARSQIASLSTSVIQLMFQMSQSKGLFSSLAELKDINAWNGERVRTMLLYDLTVPNIVVSDGEVDVWETHDEMEFSEGLSLCKQNYVATTSLEFEDGGVRKSTEKYEANTEIPSGSLKSIGPYKCTLCLKEFKTQQALNGHRKAHIVKEVICGHCTQHFSSEEQLSSHLKLHQEERNFCCICQKTISMYSLFEHLLHHQNQEGKKEAQCNVCRRMFKSALCLAHHINVHQGRYSCLQPDCKKTFVSKSELDDHRSTHSSQSPMLQCNYCRIAVRTPSGLEKHQEEHEKTFDSRPFVCKNCDKLFKSATTLRRHIHEKHEGGISLQCKVCDKIFATKPSLIRHEKYHEEQPQYRCDECNKCFRHKCKLESHMRQHTGTEGHKCQDCSVAFPEAVKLRKHLWQFHQDAEKPSFTCTVCYKTFETDVILRDHVETMHDKLKCKVCDHQFKYATHLKEHLIRQHAPVRPYTCPVSPTRGFVRQSYLNAHMERNHPGLPIPENLENVTFVVEMV